MNGLEQQGEDGVAWAWSIATALLEGARKQFDLDDDDLDVLAQTARDGDGEGLLKGRAKSASPVLSLVLGGLL